MYLKQNMYTTLDNQHIPRYKTPCAKLRNKNLQNTYHDPKEDKIINLNNYLGLDKRGQNKLNILKRKVSREIMNTEEDIASSSLISPRSNKVDLQLDINDYI